MKTNWQMKLSTLGLLLAALLVGSGLDLRVWGQAQNPSIASGVREDFRGLTLRTHPDADVAAYKVYLDHADEIVMHDGQRVAGWDDLVADITASGANGLDTGSEGASRWYEIHAIRKSSDGTKGLLLHRAKNYGADQTFGGDSSNDNVRVGAADRVKLAQGFQITTAGPLPFIDLQIAKSNTPTGNLWVTIEADTAGNPSGTPLATSDKFDVSVIPTTRGWVRFIFRTPVSLSAATQYHIVLQGDWAMNGSNVIAWRGDGTGYANGSGKKFDGTNWAAAGVADFSFKTYVTQNDTAVTMPTGYNQRAKVGWVYNNSSSNFKDFQANNRDVQLGGAGVVLVTGGAATTPTLLDASAALPPVALFLTRMMLSTSVEGVQLSYTTSLGPGNYEYGGLFVGLAGAYVDSAAGGFMEFQHLYYKVVSGTTEIYARGYRW